MNNTVNTSMVGNYSVTYDVMDAQTNQAVRVTRLVNVVDTLAPVITLIGSGVVNIYQSGSYIDSGATWTDIVDGGGTLSSATSGSVNVFLTGTYTLSYTHTDVAGNTGIPATRLVNVVPAVSTGSTNTGSTNTGSTSSGSTNTGSTSSGSINTGNTNSSSTSILVGPGGGGGGGGGGSGGGSSSSSTSSNSSSSGIRNTRILLSSAPFSNTTSSDSTLSGTLQSGILENPESTLSRRLVPVLRVQPIISLSVQDTTRVNTEYKESINSLVTTIEDSHMKPMDIAAQQRIYGTFIQIWRDIANSSNPT